MADQRKSGFCRECKKRSVVTRPGTNHVLHLILTVLTLGVWVFIWMLASMKIGGWRCATCGGTGITKVR